MNQWEGKWSCDHLVPHYALSSPYTNRDSFLCIERHTPETKLDCSPVWP